MVLVLFFWTFDLITLTERYFEAMSYTYMLKHCKHCLIKVAAVLLIRMHIKMYFIHDTDLDLSVLI